MADTPSGMADGTLRDGAEASSRVVVNPFWSKGRMLPPILGPGHRGTKVHTYFGGAETVSVEFGDFTSYTSSIWTTLDGLEALVGELQAALVRARIEVEREPAEVPEQDIPW